MENELVAVNNNDDESIEVRNRSDAAVETSDNSQNEDHSRDENELEDGDNVVPNIHDFDINLPATHSYLGSNLEELRGRTMLDNGVYMNLPLLIKKNVILFPGQTLPIVEFRTAFINMLEKCMQNNRTFGVICHYGRQLESIGTTAEIYEYAKQNEEEGFRIKSKGRQRFVILEIKQNYSEITANVKIIPEKILPDPLFHCRLMSLDKLRTKFVDQEFKKQDKLNMYESALTSWPFWVYRQYNPHKLAYEVRRHLLFIKTRGGCIPKDPSDLSFWVAQNLPLNNTERIKLLKYDSAISRLQWELKYLMKDRLLICCICNLSIGKQSDIIVMNKEGPQSTFCNYGGHMHDTITLSKVKNLSLSKNSPSTVYSWFPGFAWTVASCRGCNSHMGWRFTAVKNKNVRPKSFWGLTRDSLKSKEILKRNE